jgi:hypothetical protein
MALAACLVARIFAAGQGNDGSKSTETKTRKSNSEAVATRMSEMQKSIDA